MQIYPTTVVSNQHIADQTPLLTIKKPADFAFTAGQFVKLRLPQIETTDPLADWRWFSIASAPHQ
jgi:NAD(P)H-flavin reductase